MGSFRIEIQAVGGHGCDRTAREGETITGCGQSSCPDCAAKELVREFAKRFSCLEEAVLRHWPGSTSEVVDDLAPEPKTQTVDGKQYSTGYRDPESPVRRRRNDFYNSNPRKPPNA